MRTYAARQRDIGSRRYTGGDEDWRDMDPRAEADAKKIVASVGGKKAARLALARLWEEFKKGHATYYVEAADLPAPLPVLFALETLGLIADVTTNLGSMTQRFELTEVGLGHCARSGNR